jgi:outer membrane protein OmpA-like peptidoglycan-associated protein
MTQTKTLFAVTGLLIGSAFGGARVQAQTDAQTAAQNALPPNSSDAARPSINPDDSGTYATGKPLEMQSREGFWGHLNPFARKNWVHRQIDPVKDRVNELDQLQAKNANDIRDVDSRATAGINKAMLTATTADQHAADARMRADAANSTAMTASEREQALHGTVEGLDQYTPVTAEPLPFAAGRTTLGPKGKATLDELTEKLGSEKGYIVEVQGFSRSGVQTSQAMADSVVRYLVEHQVPVYRIFRTGLGKETLAAEDGEKPLANGVRVTLLHNSLASINNAPQAPEASQSPAAAGQSPMN